MQSRAELAMHAITKRAAFAARFILPNFRDTRRLVGWIGNETLRKCFRLASTPAVIRLPRQHAARNERAVVVGMGNVALDVARVLIRSPAARAATVNAATAVGVG